MEKRKNFKFSVKSSLISLRGLRNQSIESKMSGIGAVNKPKFRRFENLKIRESENPRIRESHRGYWISLRDSAVAFRTRIKRQSSLRYSSGTSSGSPTGAQTWDCVNKVSASEGLIWPRFDMAPQYIYRVTRRWGRYAHATFRSSELRLTPSLA